MRLLFRFSNIRLYATLIFFLVTLPIGVAATLNGTETVGEPPAEPLTADPMIEEEVVTVFAGPNALFLPLIASPNACNLNSDEQALAELALNDASQGRPMMNCDPILSQVARERAMDMAQRSYFGHTNPDGDGPNHLVEEAGYELPSWYSKAQDGNNIESIAAGYTSANAVWSGWLSSSGHRAHVLAESAFWQSQTNYGIGYYYDSASPYRHYWVFISAPPEE